MEKMLGSQHDMCLSDLLGFNPGPAYGRVMWSLRERVLLRLRESQLKQQAREIFPEEFEEMAE